MSDWSLTKKEYAKLISEMQKKGDYYSVFTIDLNGILSLTADKLSMLVYCKQYADQKGVRIVLRGVSPTLAAFFELTRMHNFFATASGSLT